MKQFKPSPEWKVQDDLTIPLEHLNAAVNYTRRYFNVMTGRMNQQNQNQNQLPAAAAAQRPDASQAAAVAGLKQAATAAADSSGTAALNAQNLQHLQKQEEATLKNSRRASSKSIVTAPFGAPSPSGAPHAYGPGGFTPEKLKIPPNKRRKVSQAAQAQAEAKTEPSTKPSQVSQQQQMEANNKSAAAPAAVGGPFKCSVVECQHHYHGFSSQGLLDKHVEASHKAEEPIENALDFALESFRTSLDNKNEDKTGGGVEMQRVASKAGTTPGRLGGYKASPPSTTTPGKLPLASRDEKKEASIISGSTTTTKSQAPTPENNNATRKHPWTADNTVSLDAMRDAFEDMSATDNNSLYFNGQLDLVNEFLNPDMLLQEDVEDESPDSSGIMTPKDHHSSSASDERPWIPADWINVPSRFEDDALHLSWRDIDWNEMERKDVEFGAGGGFDDVAMFAL